MALGLLVLTVPFSLAPPQASGGRLPLLRFLEPFLPKACPLLVHAVPAPTLQPVPFPFPIPPSSPFSHIESRFRIFSPGSPHSLDRDFPPPPPLRFTLSFSIDVSGVEGKVLWVSAFWSHDLSPLPPNSKDSLQRVPPPTWCPSGLPPRRFLYPLRRLSAKRDYVSFSRAWLPVDLRNTTGLETFPPLFLFLRRPFLFPPAARENFSDSRSPLPLLVRHSPLSIRRRVVSPVIYESPFGR